MQTSTGYRLLVAVVAIPACSLAGATLAHAQPSTVQSAAERLSQPGPEDQRFVRQYWTRADGTGRRWLAVEYEYTRRAATAMSGISTHRNWRQTGGRSNSGTG